MWDEEKQEFVYTKGTTLKLEHSLVSISKWESKWHKAFLETENKTPEETLDYIRCMTLTQNVNPEVYYFIGDAVLKQIEEYIDNPMTATTFYNVEKGTEKRTVTAELVYHWMVGLGIPFECQKWHFNRLMTLIQVCNEENKPKKKMSKKEFAAINAARRKAYKEAKAKGKKV